MACITTAYPDGVLPVGSKDGNSMLHHACSQQVVISNKQAVKIVKALLAFHPETAHITNAQKQIPLHTIALTDAPHATEIMDELIQRYPKGLLSVDVHGNTPLHLAASVNNVTGVRTLVQYSFRQPQFLPNSQQQFPLDCTTNRRVMKTLIASPPSQLDAHESLCNTTLMISSTLALLAVNTLLMMQYWIQHRSSHELRVQVRRKELPPRDARLYFGDCRSV